MSDRRVYLPLSGAELASIAGPEGAVAPTTGYAVTQRLRRADPRADEEQLEYAAFLAAAAQATRRRRGTRTRRVVAAADLDAAVVLEVDGLDTGKVDTGKDDTEGLADALDAEQGDVDLIEAADPELVDAATLGRVRLGAPVTREALVSLHVDENPAGEDALLWYDVTELSWVLALVG
ncbi:MAG: DUF6912 family protein [Dermatophilaceae bacterium]